MLTHEQMEELEKVLTTAIQEHLAKGGKLCSGVFAKDDGCLCPIACATGSNPGAGYEIALSAKLSFPLPYKEMWNLVLAFDLAPLDHYGNKLDQNNPIVKLGQKLREKYLPQG